MAEITWETGLGALQSAVGTPATNPSRLLNTALTIDPKQEYKADNANRGTTEEVYNEILVGQKTDWTGSGSLDVEEVPFWASQIVKGGVTPTQPDVANAPTAYKWVFLPNLTGNDLKVSSLWGFDPNVTRLKATDCRLNTWSIKGANQDMVMHDLGGFGKFATTGSAVAPAATTPVLLNTANSKVYIEAVGAATYGTTLLTGRLVDWSFDIPETWSEKYLPDGTADLNGAGRKKRQAKLSLQLEVPDLNEYDMIVAGKNHKVRLHIDGDTIAATVKYYLEIDIFGRLHKDSWGSYADTNRTINIVVGAVYDPDLAAGWQMTVVNTQSTVA